MKKRMNERTNKEKKQKTERKRMKEKKRKKKENYQSQQRRSLWLTRFLNSATSSYVSLCHYRTCAAILSQIPSNSREKKQVHGAAEPDKTGYVRQRRACMTQ